MGNKEISSQAGREPCLGAGARKWALASHSSSIPEGSGTMSHDAHGLLCSVQQGGGFCGKCLRGGFPALPQTLCAAGCIAKGSLSPLINATPVGAEPGGVAAPRGCCCSECRNNGNGQAGRDGGSPLLGKRLSIDCSCWRVGKQRRGAELRLERGSSLRLSCSWIIPAWHTG